MKRRYAQLLEQYYNVNNEVLQNKLKQKIYQKYVTNRHCTKCGKPLLVSDLKEYKYLCLECDENFYAFETMENKNKEN